MHASPLPKISIVTPSFNHAPFLEQTIRSVLDQNYPALEYFVLDGGSGDGSVEIIRKYADRLAYWASEPDGGQYDAINKGFARATGEIMGWLNSDDKHLPWTLHTVAQIFQSFPEAQWLTTLYPLCMDEEGHVVTCREIYSVCRHGFLSGQNLPGGDWHAGDYLQQEGTFWRRSLWETVGGRMEASLKLAGDFDLWARFCAAGAEPYGVPVPLGAFRFQSGQKTAHQMQEYFEEAHGALRKHGGNPYSKWDSFLLGKLRKLQEHFTKRYHRKLQGKTSAFVCWSRCRAGGWRISRR